MERRWSGSSNRAALEFRFLSAVALGSAIGRNEKSEAVFDASDSVLTDEVDGLPTCELVANYYHRAPAKARKSCDPAGLGSASVNRWRRQVGVAEIFVDGSFVEDKEHPNDIDGYFVCDLRELASGRLQSALNLLDPHKVWTWDPALRRPYRGYPKKQLPMWHHYRVEMYPHCGQLSGIRDKYGNELEFPSAFRLSRRDGRPRRIVKIKKEDQP